MVRIDQDTYALPSSLDIARRAAGAVVSAVDAVMTGDGRQRPWPSCARQAITPRRTVKWGFCLLNNIAIGAQHALDQHPTQSE